ncbi:hypothetical protein PCC7424_3249 [Gloeothece citriformis PCC 7424]|uniref:Glycosaminoglycan attachment site n=2 Tax=Gloeothece TaxID=28070 RepID=B7KCU8_GLOC7|nr:hypothetical protein PCC7424_3249 [Gloeothece citriformis PCC 7424]
MDLFNPIVPEERQHPHFRFMIQPDFCKPEIEVIKSWADGFIDRDHKFVKEFQTTFNSSFWELYLCACFKELGCTVDFSYETPDFVISSPYGDFIAEATTANEPDGFRPEWDKNVELLDQTSTEDILRLSTIRLSNAISKKYNKYINKYSKLSHVQNQPFVICVSPFDQPFFYFQDSLAIVRVLYAYEASLTVPGTEEGEFIFIGESRSFSVQKSPGVNIKLGLFTDDRMAEVSAIIFNNRATISKVRALAKEGSYPVIFMGSRIVQSGDMTGCQRFVAPRPNYQETILDGLHILINPLAKHPLDLKMFENREVAIHNYEPQTDRYFSEFPDGFLLQRICHAIVSKENTINFKRSLCEQPYQELPPETWAEDDLIYVGGHNGRFYKNHMAHYRGWTIVVFFDSISEEWNALTVKKLCYNIPQFMQANQDNSIASTDISEWFTTKEEAYAAIKQEIDNISQD